MNEWAEKFGDDYTKRNRNYPDRTPFWRKILNEHDFDSVLEVGCNIGFNLIPIKKLLPDLNVWGVDINEKALQQLHISQPNISGGYGDIFDLPFKEGCFDFVFTCGVLIHLHPNALSQAVEELVSVCHGTLMVMEYHDTQFTEIPYRKGMMLFRGPYVDRVADIIGKKVVETGFLGKKDGFDDVTYWIFNV